MPLGTVPLSARVSTLLGIQSLERRTAASYEHELAEHRATESELRKALARDEVLLRQKDVSIRQLAEMVREVVGFKGQLEFDTSKPDGMLLKALDSSPLLALGWRPRTRIREGLAMTYEDYLGSRPAV